MREEYQRKMEQNFSIQGTTKAKHKNKCDNKNEYKITASPTVKQQIKSHI